MFLSKSNQPARIAPQSIMWRIFFKKIHNSDLAQANIDHGIEIPKSLASLCSARVAGDGIGFEHTDEGQIPIALVIVESIPHHKLIGYFEA